MNCCSCTREIPASAKFCPECGARSSASCAACGAELLAGAKFCAECGAAQSPVANPRVEREPLTYTPKYLADKILTTRSALEGERKQVTVLFADVKGSTDLAAELDPEDWHGLLDRFFQILAEGVHRYEGTVNQYTGDGIMALFGAPIAHEDHAQRACFAALKLRDELARFADELRLQRGLDFATRIGIHSGEVVVGKIGDDLRMDYTAQGPVPNVAARLQEIAGANGTCVSAETARIVSGYFALRDLGKANLKGVPAPMQVFRLEGLGPLRSRLDVARVRGLSRFVGREAEMALLEAALARATAGRGQVLGVVAEAGTGKSRLCFEFAERCRARGVPVRVAQGVAHGKSVPLLPVLELYRSTFGIGVKDSERAAREKIAGRVVELDESLVASLPLLYDFLGVPDAQKPVTLPPGPERQTRLLALLRRLTIARGRTEPAVILFEDLHWVDPVTAGFVENLVDAAEGSRTLLLVNFRPEFGAEWMRRSCYQQLALTALPKSALLELLADLLGSDASLAGLAERIHARTEGNPFFAEEIVQSLVESGALAGSHGAYRLTRPSASLELPPSVQVVLASRIDRVGESAKAVLQAAAVIGREFGEALLRRVVECGTSDLDAGIRALRQGEFIHETTLYPEAEYAFKHPLTQEVAYASQLRERRARTHARVARALAEIHAGRLDENAVLLAQHWEAAGEPLEAARWRRRAAAWIATRDTGESLAQWKRVRELLAPLPESSETLELRAAALAQIVFCGARVKRPAAELEAAFEEGMGLARRSGDSRAEVMLLLGHAILPGRIDLGAADSRNALAVAECAADASLQLAAGAYAANFGRPSEALALTDRLIALASGDVRCGTELLGNSPFLHLHSNRVTLLIALGRLREAEAARTRALELVEEHDDPMTHARIYAAGCRLAEALGDEPRMVREALRASEIAEGITNALLVEELAPLLLRARVASGDVEAAEQLLAARTPVLQAAAAALHLARGDVDKALRTASELAEWAERLESSLDSLHINRFVMNRVPDARMLRARARLRLHGAAARSAVESDVARMAELIEALGIDLYRPDLHELRAELARALGDEAGAERELREARRLLLEMGATERAARLSV